MQDRFNVRFRQNSFLRRIKRLKVLILTWVLVSVVFVVWAESAEDDHSLRMENLSQENSLVQLIKDIAGLKERMMVQTQTLENNRSIMQSLREAIDSNSRQISAFEARMMPPNQIKDTEINRLNADLGAAIAQVEVAERTSQKLESWLRQSMLEKERRINDLEALAKGTQEEVGALRLSKQELEFRIAQLSSEKEAEIARYTESLQLAQAKFESLLEKHRQLEQRMQLVMEEKHTEVRHLTEAFDAARLELEAEKTDKQDLLEQYQRNTTEKDVEIARLIKEIDEVSTRLGEAREQNDGLMERLASAQQNSTQQERKLQEMTDALAVLSEEKEELQGEVYANHAAISDLKREEKRITGELELTLGKLQDASGREDQMYTELESVRRELSIAAEKLRLLQAQKREATNALHQVTEERRQLQNQLQFSLTRLTPDEGGTASIKSIREQASRISRSYTEAFERQLRTGAKQSTDIDSDIAHSRLALMGEQMLIGRLTAATGVYTVQPKDTLSRISYLMYGESKHWPKIFDANSHILGDPDWLLPGFALVIP